MLGNVDNVVVQILYIFVLRAEVCSTFEPIVVAISARNAKIYKTCEICRAIFSPFYNISTKLCNFTNFKMLFLAVVIDFVLLV